MQPPISSSLDPTRESLQSTRLQLNSLQSHQIPVSGTSLPLTELTDLHISPPHIIPNGTLPTIGGIDARYSATYGNPYLRTPNIGLPTPNTANPAATPAPPPYSRDNSRIVNSSGMVTASANVVNTVIANGANGAVPQVTRLPNSPTSQYIVPTTNVNTLKRGTMATHV